MPSPFVTGGGYLYDPNQIDKTIFKPSGGGGSGKGGVVPAAKPVPPGGSSSGSSGSGSTSSSSGYLDPAIKDETLNLIKQMISGAGSVGSAESYNLAANRLRERVGQVANQQRKAYINNFVARGIGASPALYSDDYLGGVNTSESQALTEGLLGLQQQDSQNKVAGLGILNNALGGYLGLGELDFNANSFAQQLLENSRQFNAEFGLKKDELKKGKKGQDMGYILQLLQGLGILQ